jgi:hypothetical protein
MLTTEPTLNANLWQSSRGELLSSLLNAAVADVELRARHHLRDVGPLSPTGGAGHARASERGNETSGDTCGDSRSAFHKAYLVGDGLELYPFVSVAPHNAVSFSVR